MEDKSRDNRWEEDKSRVKMDDAFASCARKTRGWAKKKVNPWFLERMRHYEKLADQRRKEVEQQQKDEWKERERLKNGPS